LHSIKASQQLYSLKKQYCCLFNINYLEFKRLYNPDKKRLKTTLFIGKITRKPFEEAFIKELEISVAFDEYNFGIQQIDVFDYLLIQNLELRHVWRKGSQAIKHWLLCIVLVNTFLIALYSRSKVRRSINFRFQQDFKLKLLNGFIELE